MSLKYIVPLAALLAAPAAAAVTPVFAPESLNGPARVVEDFEDTAFDVGISFSGGTRVQADGTSLPTPSGSFGYAFATKDGGVAIGAPLTLEILFAAPVRSAGLFFGNDDPCCTAALTVTLDVFTDMGLAGSVDLAANMNDAADQFVGFNSSEANITRLALTYGLGRQNLSIYVDDVQFGAPAALVPAPAALALLGLGLLGLSMVRRLR